MLAMCCPVLAEPKERLSCRFNPVLRRKIPTSYRTFNAQGDCWRLNPRASCGFVRKDNAE